LRKRASASVRNGPQWAGNSGGNTQKPPKNRGFGLRELGLEPRTYDPEGADTEGLSDSANASIAQKCENEGDSRANPAVSDLAVQLRALSPEERQALLAMLQVPADSRKADPQECHRKCSARG